MAHRTGIEKQILSLVLALLLGGLFTLAFAPFQLLPLAFLSLSGLLWLLFSVLLRQQRLTRG